MELLSGVFFKDFYGSDWHLTNYLNRSSHKGCFSRLYSLASGCPFEIYQVLFKKAFKM